MSFSANDMRNQMARFVRIRKVMMPRPGLSARCSGWAEYLDIPDMMNTVWPIAWTRISREDVASRIICGSKI